MEQTTIEYAAHTVSPRIKGETKLVIAEKALTVKALFDADEIPFSEINSLSFVDYAVTVRADGGDYVFSKMGNWGQPFFDLLCDAYNRAVLRSLFVKGDPLVTAKGDYSYTEASRKAGGAAPVYVYENCVVILPTNLGARRVPLCFTNGMDKGDHELTLRLDTGESYTWARLGYDTAPFAQAAENQIMALREKTLTALKEIDPTLTAAQASEIAKLVPQGAAASFGQLENIAPSLVKALEAKLAATRAADYYNVFKELCDPSIIYIGFRRNEAYTEGEAGPIEAEYQAEEEAMAEAETQDPFLLWLITPSPDGRFAAVEFAEPNSATFVYDTGGDFDAFARQLNRALEAIAFKREVIRLTDEELRKPENADYYMAAKRTAALIFIRANFIGRVIHSSPDAWKNKLKGLLQIS